MVEKYPITTWIPGYDEARKFLQFLEGERFSLWRSMIDAIYAKWKSPDMKGKWSDPEVYIPLVTYGEVQDFAFRIWHETKFNPRDTGDSVDLAEHHSLADWTNDIITLTETGKQFLDNDENTVAKIDRYEGILVILEVAAAQGPSREGDFVPAFQEFFRRYTTFSQKNTGLVALRYRLHNLSKRGLLERRGKNYQVTDAGINYLVRWPAADENATRMVRDFSHYSQIIKLNNQNDAAISQHLAQHLSGMHPIQFEHLVKHLLEVMGYENVEVTSAGNDKGVDVVADIELGISRVREVIQVKRQKSNVGRVILDSLRGSLHRFDAVRATIITTSGFSAGAKVAAFEKGAAPITLIDRERLLDLLIEHEIGVRRRPIRILEFDVESLSEFQSQAGLESASST